MELKFNKDTTEEQINKVEKRLAYQFPEDFKKDFLILNGGYPTGKLILVAGYERVITKFLSMNDTDKESFMIHNKSNDFIFFATDPMGNYFGFDRKTSEVIYLNKKTGEYAKAAYSWKDFLSRIYE